MDGQQHNVPEQYFATPDGAPDISDEDHATAILGTPMETDASSFSLASYEPLPPGGRIPSQQQHHHQHQFTYHEGSSSIARANPSFGFGAVSGPGPSAYQTSSDWQQAGQHLMFANAASVPMAVPAQTSLASFGYDAFNEAPSGEHTEDPAMSHGHGYVAPMDTTLQMGYGYNWETQDAAGMEYEPTPLQSPTAYSSTAVSPLGTGAGTSTGTPTSYASSSSGGQYTTMYSGSATLHTQAASAMEDESAYAGVGDERESTPVPKRARARNNAPRSDRQSFQTGSSSSTTPTMSISSSANEIGMQGPGVGSGRASRAASSSTSRQPEKREEKKTRSSHNLVEKQYRNRLNAQFEGLMNALPESLRLQGASLGIIGESGEVVTSDTPERKPSKAEVLEMARMHIRALEQERDTLVDERDGLLDDINRLRDVLASRSAENRDLGGL